MSPCPGDVPHLLGVPIARNRIQSYQDKERTRTSGRFIQGDAAFADYLVNLNVSFRFGGKHGSMPADVHWFDTHNAN